MLLFPVHEGFDHITSILLLEEMALPLGANTYEAPTLCQVLTIRQEEREEKRTRILPPYVCVQEATHLSKPHLFQGLPEAEPRGCPDVLTRNNILLT